MHWHLHRVLVKPSSAKENPGADDRRQMGSKQMGNYEQMSYQLSKSCCRRLCNEFLLQLRNVGRDI